MAAVVTVTLIGNLRVQASETVQRDPVAAVPEAERFAAPVTDAPKDWRITVVSDEASIDSATDGVEVVPAIYAWNPDVRFVYFRHVSKWM